ncbi:MAG TPA: tetratricopeptide repeat protein [Chitinophagaceae bacterium]|nr:tetratricopeptide repeat protein [Chitinophagaceae bacterium]
MRKMGWVILALFLLPPAFGQQAHLDSLLNLLKAYAKDDTVKLNLLNDIAYDYCRIDAGKGLQTADKAIALAQKLNIPAKLATSFNYKGINYSSKGQDSLALACYNHALVLYRQAGNLLRVGATYNNMAISFVNLSNYAEALEYHTKAFAIFEQLNDKTRMGNSLNNIGVIYLYVADYSKALEYYLKALAIFETAGNKNAFGNTLSNIGLVYDHLSNFPRALEYQNRALAVYRENGDKAGMASALGNIGNVYQDMDSSTKALALYQQALVISEQSGNQRGIASNYGNIGIVYNSLGNYAKALEYLQKSMAMNTAAGDKQRMAGDYNQLGKLYLNAPAAFLQKQYVAPGSRYNKVIELESRALAVAEEIGSADIQRDVWETMSKVYEAANKNGLALTAYKQYIAFRDSVVNTETKQNILRKEMQFEFEKKQAIAKAESDKQKVLANAEIHRQQLVRNALIFSGAVIFLAALVTFIFYKKRRDAAEHQKEAEFNMLVTDTEMKALRAQMNPHFIFNSLNSISDYIQKSDAATAAMYAAKFAKLMRMILENSEKKEVCLADDLEALSVYMELERLRLDNKFDYSLTVADNIDADNTLLPPLLLQPFVENSIWHGISKKAGRGKITVHIEREGEMLKCTVNDDGVGRSEKGAAILHKPAGKSFGLKVTQSRIEILNKLKKSSAAVTLTDLEQGMRVEVVLPFETSI